MQRWFLVRTLGENFSETDVEQLVRPKSDLLQDARRWHCTWYPLHTACPLQRVPITTGDSFTTCSLHSVCPFTPHLASLSVGLIRVWVVWCVFAEKKLFSQLNFNWIWTVAASQKQEAAGNERHREGSKVLWSLVKSGVVWWSLVKSGEIWCDW